MSQFPPTPRPTPEIGVGGLDALLRADATPDMLIGAGFTDAVSVAGGAISRIRSGGTVTKEAARVA